MINTILNGFFSITMTVLNWFLDPIWNVIDNINIGGTSIADLLNTINNLFDLLTNVMSWIVDATGLPRALFLLMFGIYLVCLTLRATIYIIKMLLRWWDKIIA